MAPRDGEVELLAHRRLKMDDYRGVQEALDDASTVVARLGVHSVLPREPQRLTPKGPRDHVAEARRRGFLIEEHPLTLFRIANPTAHPKGLFKQALPNNVHVLRMEVIASNP